MRTPPARHPAARFLLPLTALALVLAACGGDADEATPEAVVAEADTPEVSAPLPTNDGADAPVTSGACLEDEPDCEDTVADGGATTTCLAGAEDCADDPSNGVDQARPLPIAEALPDAEPLQPGETDGATGAPIVAAVTTDAGVGVAVDGTVCDVVQDVLVLESETEVRLLVLTGLPAGVECELALVPRTVEVELSSPLGERTLLDLAG